MVTRHGAGQVDQVVIDSRDSWIRPMDQIRDQPGNQVMDSAMDQIRDRPGNQVMDSAMDQVMDSAMDQVMDPGIRSVARPDRYLQVQVTRLWISGSGPGCDQSMGSCQMISW